MHRIHPSRREVLGGLAAAALAARSPHAGAEDKPGEAGRFDFHHHFIAPALAKKFAEKAPSPGPSLSWTPEHSIEAMGKSGVATAFLFGMISMSPDGKDEVVPEARIVNEYGAKLVADHKGRFGLFAVLPLPHIDENLKEIGYASRRSCSGRISRSAILPMWPGDWRIADSRRTNSAPSTATTRSRCCRSENR